MKTKQLIASVFFIALLSVACSSNDSDPVESCDSLSAATATAFSEYSEATTANLVEKCNAYKTALQNQINGCGDTSGALQDQIDGLDCTPPTASTGTLSMSLGSAPLVFDMITVTTTGTTRHIHGEKSTTSYEIDFDVEVGQTGANKINNFKLRLFSQNFTPLIPAAFGNNWGSNITVNSATSVVGTFHGELVNEGQTSVQDLLSGVVNINF